ncbi:MAG TPA: membrane-bound PQQ-dependent dehydrogenase, glucose/quinate/shikimate family [Dyella sp.]|nr:membrane-bound PQQ-dependent dehydrogenase, glucose/quinate/shikimate family [Dyella sp.]HET6432767.1 membrane-bound PQQ-dependent dehydrogenase, glucose/quinate/shikimate family [Dyella sp.]
MIERDGRATGRGWPITLGVVIGLLALAMIGGGAWLITLGGSWYYALAGLALLVAAVQLARGLRSGAWWFFGVLAATVLWTLWESGLDYWGWIPRDGLLVLLGIAVALCLPRLVPHTRRPVWIGLAVVLALVFAGAFALVFAPHNVYHSGQPLPAAGRVASAAPVIAPAQPANAPAAGDWAAYGRNNAATRYTPLNQITPQNVDQLKQAWVFHTGDLPKKRYGAETTPLKIGDRLYLCTARNVLIALDAHDGHQLWRYDPKVQTSSIPYTAACRGVAYYATPAVSAEDALATPPGDQAPAQSASAPPPVYTSHIAAAPGAPGACDARIIEGTLDGRLIAVDAATGKPCADFGDHGQVDITRGMGETPAGYVAITSAPTIVRGVVVTGHQVLDGQRRWAPSGVILGYDAVSGKLRWAWDMVHPERNGLPPPGKTFARGTPDMWTTATGDEQLGLVYIPLGAPTGQYLSSSRRPAENEYSDSLVALDVSTGRPAWRFQSQQHGVWDYDLGSQASLVDFPAAGGSVPALVLPTKQGDMYVLDRRTGQPLTGIDRRPVPGGGVEPDQRAPTQPFSRYHTVRKSDLTASNMWGLTPVDQLACRIQFRQADYRGVYTPPTSRRPWIEYPGYNGGSDWGGVAIDPHRGVIVANYNDIPNYDRMVPRAQAQKAGWKPRDEDDSNNKAGPQTTGFAQLDTPYGYTINAGWRLPVTKMPCKEPPYGGIQAIDLKTGRTLWDRPLGTALRNGPFGLSSHLPFTIGTPNNGGSVVTASGLIFIAAATDDLIRAIDLASGKTLWTAKLPAGGQATPIVYRADGREYLVIMAAGHHFMETPEGDSLVAYALPQ